MRELGHGPDRITRNEYDAAGQLLRVEKALGTPIQHDYAKFGYMPNGKRKAVTDATVNAGDREEYRYDAADNRTYLRKRDGSILTFEYDPLNRMTQKVVPERAGLTPAQTRDVHYSYDVRGLQLKARFDALDGEGVTIYYDRFGLPTTTLLAMGGHARYVSFYHDDAGNRVWTGHPDGAAFGAAYDALGRMTQVSEVTASPGINDLIVRYWYNAAGSRHSAVRGAGSGGFYTIWYRDPLERPTVVANDLPTAGNDMVIELAYNPASQITQRSVSNDAYAAPPAYNVARGYQVNGLNQYSGTTISGAPNWSFEHDPNGNMKRSVDPAGTLTTSYVYDVENRLVAASGAANATLVYDPLGRLVQVTNSAGAQTHFLYDGDRMIAEYDGSGTLLRRYVHGPGADEPVAVYDGAALGLANRRYMLPDERGSIAALINASGSPSAINRYDAWGVPGAGNAGRFQYTGQAWIPELGMYHYKARIYSPTLGRFLQTDPIGYEDQINLYAYVGNDPMNGTDPSGECSQTKSGDWVGVCPVEIGENAETKFLNERMRDDNSRIRDADQDATKEGQLIVVRFASRTLPTKDHRYGEEVRGEKVVELDGRGRSIIVTLDPEDVTVVQGYNEGSRQPTTHVESLAEMAEHAIVGHATEMMHHGKGDAASIRAENQYRERKGEPFRRVGHSGWIRRRH